MKWFNEKKIVVPFDFSDDSVEAVRAALEIADSHDEVHVVHAIAPLPVNDPYIIWDDEVNENREKHARGSIVESLEKLPNQGYHIHVHIGEAADVIIDFAEKVDAGMIMIPSHGRTGIKRFFLGSVAERVVRLAQRPVLVLKSKREQ